LVIQRDGPPLRFQIGQYVQANCGAKGWLDGQVINVWAESSDGSKAPYQIRTQDAGIVTAPRDSDDCVKKGQPRFKVGDEVMAYYGGGYKKGEVTEIISEKTFDSYSIKVLEGEEQAMCTARDLNELIRPIARYDKGTKVLARVTMTDERPGTIEAVYHKDWVYAVRLDSGDLVSVPEDTDHYMKKQAGLPIGQSTMTSGKCDQMAPPSPTIPKKDQHSEKTGEDMTKAPIAILA